MHGQSVSGNLCRAACTLGQENSNSVTVPQLWGRQAAIFLHITSKVREVHGESLFQDKFQLQCKHGLKVTHSGVTSSVQRWCTLSECD